MSNYKKDEWCQMMMNIIIYEKHKEKLWKFRYYFPGLKNCNESKLFC